MAQAEQALADLLAGPSQVDIDTAEAAVLAARQALEDLENPEDGAIADARSRVAQAEQALADLLAGPSQVDIDTAEAAIFSAAERLEEFVEIAEELRPAAEAELARATRELVETREQLGLQEAARTELAAAEAALVEAALADDEAALAAARQRLVEAQQVVAASQGEDPPPNPQAAEQLVRAAAQFLASIPEPDSADYADARAQLARAADSFSQLLAGPAQADVDAAEAAVLAARQTVEDLQNPSEAALADARSRVAQAEQNLADLLAGATQADIDSAEAAVLAARQGVEDLQNPSEAALADARSRVAQAEQNLADLLAGAPQSDIDTAEAAVATAFETFSDRLAGATVADVDAAEAAVLAARQTVEDLQNPSEAALADARSRVAQAEQNLVDLLAGPSQADIDSAEAAVLVAGEALRDLLDPLAPDEVAVLEQAVTGAQAALVRARGDVADLADGDRVQVVMYGSAPAFRTMARGDEGPDVRQLEENLASLGFGDTSGFSVDGTFDEATEEAVRAWQRSLGTYVDGAVGMADVLFVSGRVRIGSWQPGIEVGQDIIAGTPLAGLTAIEAPTGGVMATTQRVVAQLPLAERDLLAEGDTVNVEFPDNSDVAGTVVLINPAPLTNAQGEGFVEVTITLAEAAPVVWIGASVDVEIVKTLVPDALVVPATALLALVEGGYAVEVVQRDGTTVLVGVETGLFADGDVVVRATGLQEGATVVVPR